MTSYKAASNKKSAKSASAISHVRIIGGEYRRRLIPFVDADGLRPTPDRVRETVFNWLADDIINANVLDCCAGSGVLGFEALSRGAKKLTCAEPNRAQFAQIKATQAMLAISNDKFVAFASTIEHALSQLINEAPFDVVFIDPPYQLNLWGEILQRLLNQQLICQNTLLYIESDQDHAMLLENIAIPLQSVKYKKMGQIYAGIYTLA